MSTNNQANVLRQTLSNIWHIATNPKFYVIVIIALLLIVLGNLYMKQVQAKMKITLLNIDGLEIDWWSVTHIILYIYFGYFFPNYFVEFFIIGVIWELFESFFCQESVSKLLGCHKSEHIWCRGLKKVNSCDYWYGKIDDLAMNSIGFIIGMQLARWKTKKQSN